MKIFLRIISVPVLAFAAFMLFTFGQVFISIEGYNPVNPSIDTHYAEDFSEAEFVKITPGMDTTRVYALIGRPLSIQALSETEELWYYTGDGACSWGDFAWEGREVHFANGIVTQTTTPIHYD